MKYPNGLEFSIIKNAGNQLSVFNGDNNQRPPLANNVTLIDDDALKEGDDVPSPPIDKLDDALADAYVVPTVNAYNPNQTVSFVANLTDYESIIKWDSSHLNSDAFWTTYIIGAFQGSPFLDNDGYNEQELLGLLSSNSGAIAIFQETIRDAIPDIETRLAIRRAQNKPTIESFTEDDLVQETVIHEIAHALSKYGSEDDEDTPEFEGPTRWPVELHKLSPRYLDGIRRLDAPISFS